MERHDGRGEVWYLCDLCWQGIVGLIVEAEGNHYMTGLGVLNWRGSQSKYFVHLSRLAGAEPYQFPPAFVAQCQEHQIGSGDLIGTSAITGPVYAA